MRWICQHCDTDSKFYFTRVTPPDAETVIICIDCGGAWMRTTHTESGELSVTTTITKTELDYGEAIDYVIKEYPDQLRLNDLAEFVGVEQEQCADCGATTQHRDALGKCDECRTADGLEPQ